MSGPSFRLKYKQDTITLTLTPESTVQELVEEIRDLTQLMPSRQDITFGFPTKHLATDDRSKKLKDLGVARREMFTVTEKTGAPERSTPIQGGSRLSEAVKIEIPSDNSCLFNSISYLCTGSSNRGPELRTHVMKTIKENPDIYTPLTLGCSAEEYCRWIADGRHWGGYIEMEILSKLYQVDIAVVVIEQCKILEVNACDANRTIFILYDNIHYDSIVFKGLGIDELRIVDPKEREKATELALNMAKLLQQAHQYSKPSKDLLKCEQCGKLLQGSAQAQRHAEATGHVNFAQAK